MIVCPRCKSEDYNVGKSWDVVPRSGKGRAMHVTMYSCKICGHKFRKATKLDMPALTQNTPQVNNLDIKPEIKLETTPPLLKSADAELASPLTATEQKVSIVEVEAPQNDSLFQRIRRGLGF